MKYLLITMLLSSCANMPPFDFEQFSRGMATAYSSQQREEQAIRAANQPQKVQLVDQYGRPIQFAP